ncbi:MAG: hypothetical protein M3O61_00215 [Gemmatimonadota bacterium]|nr:hypothetical protein [Gemmatimonadota bacterium]
MRAPLILAAAIIFSTGSAAAQRSPAPSVVLQAAIHQETVEGNLEKAIASYRRVISDSRADRPTVASALVRLGLVYERLGNREANSAYSRVIREFADQRTAVAEARRRLDALAGNAPAVTTAVSVRQVWAGSDVDLLGSVSPDGRQLSFVDWSTGELAVRDLTTGKTRALTKSGDWSKSIDYAERSAWSADGRRLAYAWYSPAGQYEMHVISADGGEARVVLKRPDIAYVWPQQWTTDGARVLTVLESYDGVRQLAFVRIADGAVQVLKPGDSRWPGTPSIVPGGGWIAYDYAPDEAATARDIYLMAADGSNERRVVEHSADDRLLGWSASGSHLLFSSTRRGTRDLWALPVSDGRVTGMPMLVKTDLGARVEPLGITSRGALFYGLGVGSRDVYVSDRDAASGAVAGNRMRFSQGYEGGNDFPEWSPDARRVAYVSSRPTGGGERYLVVRDADGASERAYPLPGFGRVFELNWYRDGKAVLVSARGPRSRFGLYRVDLADGRVTQILDRVIGRRPGMNMTAFSPDGRTLYYVINDTQARVARIIARDVNTGAERDVFTTRVTTPETQLTSLVLSPSGSELAFTRLDSVPANLAELLVVPVSGGATRQVARAGKWLGATAWTADGQIVYERDITNDERPGHPHELLQVSATGGQSRVIGTVRDTSRPRLSPDGRRVLVSSGEARSEVWMAENLIPGRGK